MFFYARATTKGSRNSVRLKRKISVSVFLFLDDDDSPGRCHCRISYVHFISREYLVILSQFHPFRGARKIYH